MTLDPLVKVAPEHLDERIRWPPVTLPLFDLQNVTHYFIGLLTRWHRDRSYQTSLLHKMHAHHIFHYRNSITLYDPEGSVSDPCAYPSLSKYHVRPLVMVTWLTGKLSPLKRVRANHDSSWPF